MNHSELKDRGKGKKAKGKIMTIFFKSFSFSLFPLFPQPLLSGKEYKD
jgi:hypothetical protein